MREGLRTDPVRLHGHHRGGQGELFFNVKIVVIRPFLFQRKAAKGMGMMRSPSTASLATGGQPAMLTHKVREIWSLI